MPDRKRFLLSIFHNSSSTIKKRISMRSTSPSGDVHSSEYVLESWLETEDGQPFEEYNENTSDPDEDGNVWKQCWIEAKEGKHFVLKMRQLFPTTHDNQWQVDAFADGLRLRGGVWRDPLLDHKASKVKHQEGGQQVCSSVCFKRLNRGNQEVANNELNHKDLGKIDVIVTQGIWTLSRYGYSRRGLAAVFADQTLPEDIRKLSDTTIGLAEKKHTVQPQKLYKFRENASTFRCRFRFHYDDKHNLQRKEIMRTAYDAPIHPSSEGDVPSADAPDVKPLVAVDTEEQLDKMRLDNMRKHLRALEADNERLRKRQRSSAPEEPVDAIDLTQDD